MGLGDEGINEATPRGAGGVPLPEEMPEGWVKAIKAAVKESKSKLIITTVLGSSLLTSLVTTTLNYYVMNPAEVSRQLRKEQAAAKIKSYETLRGVVERFHKEADTAAATFDVFASDPQLDQDVEENMRALLNEQAALLGSLYDSNLRDDTRARVRKVLSALTPKISAAQGFSRMPVPRRQRALDELARALRTVTEQELPSIFGHIEEVRKELTTQI